MIPLYLYTVIISIPLLIGITIYDIRTLKIHSLPNYLMIILTAISFFTFPGKMEVNLLALLELYLLIYAVNFIYKNSYAPGDLELFYWIIPCLFLFGFKSILTFLFFLSILYFLQGIVMQMRKINYLPGTPHIMGAYLLAILIGVLY